MERFRTNQQCVLASFTIIDEDCSYSNRANGDGITLDEKISEDFIW